MTIAEINKIIDDFMNCDNNPCRNCTASKQIVIAENGAVIDYCFILTNFQDRLMEQMKGALGGLK